VAPQKSATSGELNDSCLVFLMTGFRKSKAKDILAQALREAPPTQDGKPFPTFGGVVQLASRAMTFRGNFWMPEYG
jgi:hypothetical protein